MSKEVVHVAKGDFLLKWIMEYSLIFFPTVFVTGLKQGERHSKQVSIVFKAIVYATLEVKSLDLSVSGNVIFCLRLNTVKTQIISRCLI